MNEWNKNLGCRKFDHILLLSDATHNHENHENHENHDHNHEGHHDHGPNDDHTGKRILINFKSVYMTLK